ncbi:uncharacterized protein V1516DRAFT_681186 [Lipomyces oligophaga]|uniref:uncharacterized protein n=1 Tax=Lipomyces oligophaga TaxID=45792 RepID=UPI0034CF29BF
MTSIPLTPSSSCSSTCATPESSLRAGEFHGLPTPPSVLSTPVSPLNSLRISDKPAPDACAIALATSSELVRGAAIRVAELLQYTVSLPELSQILQLLATSTNIYAIAGTACLLSALGNRTQLLATFSGRALLWTAFTIAAKFMIDDVFVVTPAALLAHRPVLGLEVSIITAIPLHSVFSTVSVDDAIDSFRSAAKLYAFVLSCESDLDLRGLL